MAPAARSESSRVELMASSAGPPGSSSPLFIYFICIFTAAAPSEPPTGSLHVTAVQSDALSAPVIKQRSGVSEV